MRAVRTWTSLKRREPEGKGKGGGGLVSADAHGRVDGPTLGTLRRAAAVPLLWPRGPAVTAPPLRVCPRGSDE